MSSKALFKRGNIWWYRFTPPGSSKQVRRSTGTSDKKLAQEFFDNERVKAWRVGKLGEKPKRLWSEAAARWLEEKAHKRSIREDRGRLSILFEAMSGAELQSITNDFVREKIVKGVLANRKVAPATVNRYIALIHSILNAAYREWGWLDAVPYLSKPGQAGERQRKAWLTPEQFTKLIDALPAHWRAVARLAVATGMREDNIVQLEWGQVDLSKRKIHIPAELFKGRRDHVVPLNDTALSVIRAQIGRNRDRVFTYHGRPFASLNLRPWHRICDEIGLNDELRAAGLLMDGERFVFHGLRHTFATWLGLAGVPLEIVELIGGWSVGTKRVALIYSHLADVSHLLPFVCKIDEILAGRSSIDGADLPQDRRII